eukprot:TRINITY_DN1608_c0_g1_i1.p1 TRINITY_DN1608_c0_g1~~TRINITY_DN1608_c0_g1_i1.p1  ORF type:complete len:365 (-),score=101.65 TRINITY_DN1608_c0_g1_i1:112-1122(-)
MLLWFRLLACFALTTQAEIANFANKATAATQAHFENVAKTAAAASKAAKAAAASKAAAQAAPIQKPLHIAVQEAAMKAIEMNTPPPNPLSSAAAAAAAAAKTAKVAAGLNKKANPTQGGTPFGFPSFGGAKKPSADSPSTATQQAKTDIFGSSFGQKKEAPPQKPFGNLFGQKKEAPPQKPFGNLFGQMKGGSPSVPLGQMKEPSLGGDPFSAARRAASAQQKQKQTAGQAFGGMNHKDKVQTAQKNQKSQFELMDADKDGLVTAKEMATAKMLLKGRQSFGGANNLQDFEKTLLNKIDDEGEYMKKRDKNGDGSLSWEEYEVSAIPPSFHRAPEL